MAYWEITAEEYYMEDFPTRNIATIATEQKKSIDQILNEMLQEIKKWGCRYSPTPPNSAKIKF